mgnify:CR=1 FL=1
MCLLLWSRAYCFCTSFFGFLFSVSWTDVADCRAIIPILRTRRPNWKASSKKGTRPCRRWYKMSVCDSVCTVRIEAHFAVLLLNMAVFFEFMALFLQIPSITDKSTQVLAKLTQRKTQLDKWVENSMPVLKAFSLEVILFSSSILPPFCCHREAILILCNTHCVRSLSHTHIHK